MEQTHGQNGGAMTQPKQIDLSKEPMPLLPNQGERWHNFGNGGVGFYEAANIIAAAADKDGKRDDLGVGDISTWAFGPGPDGTASLAPIPLPGRPNHMVPLRQHAFTQLCGRIKAPSSYIRTLPGKLQMACVNHGMRTMEDKAITLRRADGAARAVLSDRYAALDDHLVLEVLESTLKAAGLLGDVRVRSAAVGTTMALRLTLPGDDLVLKSPKEGDIVEVGLDLINGELGNRSVSICPITWRLVCLNGMRRADKEVVHRLNHVGDPKRLEEAFRDAVPSALAESKGLRKQMEKAVDRLVDDLLAEFDGLTAFGLQSNEARDVARDVMATRSLALPEDTKEWGDTLSGIADMTAYDVLNGITHVAQSRNTDRRLEMEGAASKYLYRRTR